MKLSLMNKIIGAAALILTLTASAQAASVGTATIDGVKESGGDIRYKFSATTWTPTTLLIKATLTGSGLSYTFPDKTLAIPSGTTTVTGPYYTVSSTFTGKVTLAINIWANSIKISSQSVTATITKPSVIPSSVSTNLYDVGFENVVTLNGRIVPTNGMGGTITYAWSQTSGKTVVISPSNGTTPTFTTAALTNFVTMGTSLFYTNVDELGTNTIYVTREDRFATNNVNSIAFDAEQADAAIYGFKVLVSNGSITRTGLFTVASANLGPAQPTIPLGVKAYYRGNTNSTNWTLLSKPYGSTASLVHPTGLIPELRPDLAGKYIIKDNVTGKVVTNTAANWVGVANCNSCHGPGNSLGNKDMVSLWSKTGHASFFAEAVDGYKGSYYNESCIKCHTVGYNKASLAANGGFDDVAKANNWTFPTVKQDGNYAAMPAALQNKANIQCESCHGPGGQHPGSASISTDVRVCGQCHQDGSHHVRPQQWEISPHSGGFENIASSRGTNPQCSRCHSPIGFMKLAKGEANVSTTNSVPTGTGALTCQICHNPHDTYDNDERYQLRVYDTALLGNPYYRSNTVTVARGGTFDQMSLTNANLVVTNLGNAATCITCHNGRQLPTQVQIYSNAGKMFYQTGGPHDQLAAEAFLGMGMYDYGRPPIVSAHSIAASGADCQQCHQHKLQVGEVVLVDDVPVEMTKGNLSQYANIVGDHTFKMNYEYTISNVTHEVDNIAACNKCHGDVESFDHNIGVDYDGDGVASGVQTETRGLMRKLGELIVWGTTNTPPVGTVYTNSPTKGAIIYPGTNATQGILMPLTTVRKISGSVTNYITTAVDISSGMTVNSLSTTAGYYGLGNTNNVKVVEAQRKAVWNWLACYREGSFGVHNTKYTVGILQQTYTDLATNCYNNPSVTFSNVFPSATIVPSR